MYEYNYGMRSCNQGHRYKLWCVNAPERCAESGRQRTTVPTINEESYGSIKILGILHAQYSEGLARTQGRKVKQPSRPGIRGKAIKQEKYNRNKYTNRQILNSDGLGTK